MTDSNTITILVENYAYKTPFAEWGFSAHIKYNNKFFLFDVGHSGDCVLNNAKFLKIDLKKLDGIILSHGHYDHTNGLKKVLDFSETTNIYGHPNIFDDRYSLKNGNLQYTGMNLTKQELLDKNITLHLETGLTKISDNIYMSGEIAPFNEIETISPHFKVKKESLTVDDTFPDDNALIIDTPKGLIIISGCAHRGIVNIANHIKNQFKKNIFAIIGGTHLYDVSDEHFKYVLDYFKKEDIQLLAPGHCTGIEKIFKLKDALPDRVQPAFCGEVFKFQ